MTENQLVRINEINEKIIKNLEEKIELLEKLIKELK